MRRLIHYRMHVTIKCVVYFPFQHWPQVPIEKWHARDRKYSISMTTKGLCLFLTDLLFLTKEANFWHTCSFLHGKYSSAINFYRFSPHFGETNVCKKWYKIRPFMIFCLFFGLFVCFFHRPTRLLDHFSAD